MTSNFSDHAAFAPRNHKRYCMQCRVAEDDPEAKEKLLRCVRCRIGLYCSRECQKKNWPLHKRICKNLQSTWAEYDKSQEAAEQDSKEDESLSSMAIDRKMRSSSQLAMALIDFAYFSTDTVERGASVCEQALRNLLWCVDTSMKPFQNAQCLLALAACLGYDDGTLKLVEFMHYTHNNPISKDSQGIRDDVKLKSASEYNGPGLDLVYTCLLLIRMRKLAQYRANTREEESSSETLLDLEASAREIVGVCVEKCRWVFDCIPPDGDLLIPEASNDLFGSNSCWLLIQDCFVLTPGVINVFLEYSPNKDDDDFS